MLMEQYFQNTTVKEVLKVMQDRITTKSTYFGICTLKSPIDVWVYQEIIFEEKPDIIIEIGVNAGGGTLMLAHLCDNLNKGRVIGIDISLKRVPLIVRSHPRITLIEKDACLAFSDIVKTTTLGDRVLIIEDSSHTYENTLNVLRTFSSLIKLNDYFIVEDGICHHGLEVGSTPGPYEAVEQFVKENEQFQIDRDKESFLITWNPKGYLKRISE